MERAPVAVTDFHNKVPHLIDAETYRAMQLRGVL